MSAFGRTPIAGTAAGWRGRSTIAWQTTSPSPVPAPRSGKRGASRTRSGLSPRARVRSRSSRPEVSSACSRRAACPPESRPDPSAGVRLAGRGRGRVRRRRSSDPSSHNRAPWLPYVDRRSAKSNLASRSLQVGRRPHRHRHDETTLNELGGCFGYVSRPDIRRGGGAGPRLPDSCQSRSPCVGSAHQRGSVVPPSPTVGGWREGHLVVVLEDEGRRIVAQGGETHSTLCATFVVRALAAGPQQCHARAACPFGGARRCHSRGCRVVLWVQVILDQGVDDDPDPHPVRAQSLGGAGAAWASPS